MKEFNLGDGLSASIVLSDADRRQLREAFPTAEIVKSRDGIDAPVGTDR